MTQPLLGLQNVSLESNSWVPNSRTYTCTHMSTHTDTLTFVLLHMFGKFSNM